MAKFVLVYRSGGGAAPSEAEMAAVMEAWGAWFGSLGAAVKDPGNPFGASATVASGGAASDGTSSGVTGYSILDAADLAAATGMAKGCPLLASGGTVEVFEAIEM